MLFRSEASCGELGQQGAGDALDAGARLGVACVGEVEQHGGRVDAAGGRTQAGSGGFPRGSELFVDEFEEAPGVGVGGDFRPDDDDGVVLFHELGPADFGDVEVEWRAVR